MFLLYKAIKSQNQDSNPGLQESKAYALSGHKMQKSNRMGIKGADGSIAGSVSDTYDASRDKTWRSQGPSLNTEQCVVEKTLGNIPEVGN